LFAVEFISQLVVTELRHPYYYRFQQTFSIIVKQHLHYDVTQY